MLTMSYESSSGAQARKVEEPRGSMYRSCTSFTWGKVMIGVSMVPVQMLSTGIGGTYLSSVTIYILSYEMYIYIYKSIFIFRCTFSRACCHSRCKEHYNPGSSCHFGLQFP